MMFALRTMADWSAYQRGFLPWLVGGGVAAAAVIIFGRSRPRRLTGFACWLLAVLLLWGSLVQGVGAGYAAWQAIPNPPEEAFADGGPMVGTLFLGWVYSGVLCSACWALLLLISKIRRIGSRPATEVQPLR